MAAELFERFGAGNIRVVHLGFEDNPKDVRTVRVIGAAAAPTCTSASASVPAPSTTVDEFEQFWDSMTTVPVVTQRAAPALESDDSDEDIASVIYLQEGSDSTESELDLLVNELRQKRKPKQQKRTLTSASATTSASASAPSATSADFVK